MQPLKRLARLGLAASFLIGISSVAPASAQHVVVTVNGQVMSFDQPPVMRNNRVFVPMRAIFERLGSTVVFSNGNINSQGNGRSVHLVIGSTQASVNGQSITMDVAPFTVAGRTEVPLRFVAQALGANVNWNANSETVAITASGVPASQNYSGSNYNQSFYLTNQRPGSGTTTQSTHPSLHAQFSEPVNRDSLRVSVDGRDVTSDVYANTNGFDVTPNWELTPGTHHVSVTGTTIAGASFNTHWSFNTSAGAAANYVRGINPGPGARVGSSFTLGGQTLPGSTVHIVASGSATALGGLLQVGTGTFQTDVTADGNGNFSAPIALNAVSGGQVRVIITTTSPSGASLERQVVYST
ncbi:MAG TPA: copper amine oxidase N-terminal domain-containing protein [Candidatus Baltobacteraceae bacterium]|nr:copper amine oxidase N-terminal domain-containing protein [Candidatus Baltobacteraceae bacterium]